MVFIEAAACGKPSLAGEAGGTGAAVLHEKTGLRVDGTSTEAVTEGLRRLLHNREWATSLGNAGLMRVKNQFTWERVADVTLKQILGRS